MKHPNQAVFINAIVYLSSRLKKKLALYQDVPSDQMNQIKK
jgi:hypothetical protein